MVTPSLTTLSILMNEATAFIEADNESVIQKILFRLIKERQFSLSLTAYEALRELTRT